ncbi:MAG: hydroxyacid dehydrogenase [FCB group bacterium]|nr:hydroxyacid dehydrogenase [FCB group bacterium]
MSLSVHIVTPSEPEFAELLKPLLTEDLILSHGETNKSSADYKILVAGVPEESQITASAQLEKLIIPWSGLPKATRVLMKRFAQIAVHNLHHNSQAVAEMALTLMLCAIKKIIPCDLKLRQGDWTPRYENSQFSLLLGKSVLIIGYGSIGREIGQLCQGLGLNIRAISKNGNSVDRDAMEIFGVGALPDLLPECDIVFITVPLTDETRGLIGAKELALLPQNTVLINVARGSVVDQAALYQALKDKKISAGLDVWYHYPDSEESRKNTMPADFPFHELDNVVMTPHLAGHSENIEELRAQALAELLNAAARSEPMPNRVDLDMGY